MCTYFVEHQGQNTGGAFAVTKGLVGQAGGEIPQHFVW